MCGEDGGALRTDMLDAYFDSADQKMGTFKMEFNKTGWVKCCLCVYGVKGKVDSEEGCLDFVVVSFDGNFDIEFPQTIRMYKTSKKILFGIVSLDGEEK